MPVPSDILKSVKSLRPLSQSAARLLQIINNPNHNLKEVVRVVEVDSVLTANILRVVNSAAFSRRNEVTTVDRALPILGEKMVVGVALGICTSHLFNEALDGYASEEGELWRHSLRCAIAARDIAEYSKDRVSPDVAFTAGILHDLGKSVISTYLEGNTHDMAAGADRGQFADYIEAEQKTLGTDHAEVGGIVAKHWNLPPPLMEVMRCHHAPADAPPEHRALVYVVHLADFVAMMGGTGTGADTMVYRIDERYKEYVTISRKELAKVLLRTGDEYEKNVAITFSS